MILPDMLPYRSEGDFANARRLAETGLSLPLNPYLKKEEVEFIIEMILNFFCQVVNFAGIKS
ncbi:hypothetical protein [Algoriphagus boritolerans]|uniref:hypothetical protein n=1 Tax=Algoriphagus boritolerans TaxID=308111 RepID=UPI002FCDE7E9